MDHVARYSSSAVMAGFVTISLFLIMQLLVISKDQPALDELPAPSIKIIPAPELEEKIIRKAIERPEVSPPAPPVPRPDQAREKIISDVFPDFVRPDQDDIKDDLMTGNTDPVLKFAVLPPYPVRAQTNGIEGYALVEFTITADGRVTNAVLLDESPTGYSFGVAALKAIVKFRYEPRVTGDKAIPVHNVREQFLFELPEE